MLTEADIASVRYARLDEEDVGISSIIRCFAPVHEELVVSIIPLGFWQFAEEKKLHTLTLGFDRDGQPHELSAFVSLSEVEYTIKQPKVIRFTSLGGYLIAPTETKD